MKCNQKELAGIMGLSERTVQDLVDEGLPVETKGKRGRSAVIETAQAIPWFVERQVQKKLEATARTREVENQRERLVKAQADSMEMEIRRKTGELAPVAELRVILQDFFVFLGRQHDGLASTLATPLANLKSPGEVRARLLDELRRLRAAAADQLAGIGVNRGNIEPAPAPAQPDPEPVGGPGAKTARRKRPTRRLPK